MAKPRIPISVPTQEITMKDLAKVNPKVTGFTLHRRVQEWLEQGQVKRAGILKKERGGKGLNLYEPTRC